MNIEEIEKSFKKGIKKKKSEDLQYKKEKMERRQNEKNIPKKLSFARIIFDWRKEFLSTDTGMKILKRFDNKLKVCDNGDLVITEKGFGYASGMSRMGGYGKYNTPEELAKNLEYDFLKEFSEDVKSGKVEKDLKKYLEDTWDG